MTTGSEPERFGVRPGVLVVTCDGEELGSVKECEDAYFKVAAALQPDYWLQTSLASPDGDGRVIMDFNRQDLEQYKVRNIHSGLRGDPGNLSDNNLLDESGRSPDEAGVGDLRPPTSWG